ncbi:hypothetical protein THRCLA_20506 [Thraustotheca clavata]|uniref:Uncharacterized protein n=1 Tax=Thraustotheca clavata TaxID=74557 RepID=A0A1W0A6H0_9STRA|nr:hypothetical protein THRCLA_20506 [Thraustotheca clavata]
MSETITAPGLVQKEWSSNSTIEGLYLHLPGRVVVSYDANSTSSVAVTISSDTPELLDLVSTQVDLRSFDVLIEFGGYDILVDGDHPVINITTLHPNQITSGALLVNVVLNDTVTYLWTQAQTIIRTGVLDTSSATKLKVNVQDNGSLYYADTEGINVAEFLIDVSDSALLQLTTPNLAVSSKLSLSAEDNGVIAIAADATKAKTIKSDAEDSGAIYIEATKSFFADKLISDAEDSGTINYYPQGTCETSKVDAEDDGSVFIGSIVCVDSYASASDVGSIVLQTTGILHASTEDDGVIEYFNATPSRLPKTHKPSRWFKSRDAQVLHTTKNEYQTYKFLPTPPSEPIAVTLYPLHSRGYWGWIFGGGSATIALKATQTPLQSSMQTSAIVASVAIMVFVALFLFKRASRRPYQRLH